MIMVQKFFLLYLLLIFSIPAIAETYFGASAGNADIDKAGLDKSDTLKIFLGSRRAHVGGEVTYYDFDKFSVNNSSANITGEALELSGVGFKSLGAGFEFFGKFGFLLYDFEASSTGLPISSGDGIGAGVGIGFQYRPIDVVALRLEFQHFFEIENSGFDILSFGLAFHF